jgi:hypothetical protein
MKMLLMLPLLLSCLSSQPSWAAGAEKNPPPLTLTVTGAQSRVDQAGAAADIMGYLSNDPQHRPMSFYCDRPVTVNGPDRRPKTYVALYGRGTPPTFILIHVEVPQQGVLQVVCSFQPR